MITRLSTPVKWSIIIGHALLGWMYCGALIGIGRQFMPMQETLIIHAIGAPVGFTIISLVYFKKFAFTSPLKTALIFLGIIIIMDFFVVAMSIEKSFAMFKNLLGTWIPFLLIFCATYLTGKFCASH
jgi:hypothetical protein